MKKVVIVEDDPAIRANLIFHLRQEGFVTKAFDSAETAWDHLIAEPALPALMLVDVRLKRESGIDLVRKLHAATRLPPTIIVSGEATISEAVEALRLGVYDFIEKPFSRDRLLRSIQNCLGHTELVNKVRDLESQLEDKRALLGDSEAMLLLKLQIGKVAPTMGRVLILGESGVGKELVANAIHQQSARADKPFIKINCAAIPANLIEDELFGHVRGAFTDAKTNKSGLFEEADGGTLFLDEIGDMDLTLQTRLLRVLEDNRVRRIGATVDRTVDVRVIAATHQNLERLVASGQFRQDLFFRLSTLPIQVPPLRNRREDIPLLMTHFVQLTCRENHMRQKLLDPKVFDALANYDWPGNIRELRNLCERLVILGGDPITSEHLPALAQHQAPLHAQGSGFPDVSHLLGTSLKDFKRGCEKAYIEYVLDQHRGNVAQAARSLDMQRTYLYQKAHSLQITI